MSFYDPETFVDVCSHGNDWCPGCHREWRDRADALQERIEELRSALRSLRTQHTKHRDEIERLTDSARFSDLLVGAWEKTDDLRRDEIGALQLQHTKDQERIEEATELLKMEREWAGCFCHITPGNGPGEHDPDCTWPAWLERYARFLSPTPHDSDIAP